MKKDTQSPKKTDQDLGGFSEEEKAAMKERVKELKAERRGKSSKVDGEAEVLAKIAALGEFDKPLAERLHEIIKAAAPGLSPKTWYGMPAYANKDGKVVCFFRPSQTFKERYMTFGFNQEAKLDDGSMWPIAFAVTGLSDTEEARVADLVRRAVGP